ncbi:hypothetical protein [Lactococcus lactis]|uniref:hypothetical protein n=1 Tax=Lactococcus lactis TaxID=1358 RepID=UPI001911D9C7|nr:hypothetical protein [Lactococcus lactis]WDA67449.1 hypothetical protein IL310_01400 [Lactococcus lactis]WDA67480.1 hypothetical protein IL310_00975 [Lactococcus lactis]
MLNEFITLNPYLSEFPKDIKNKKFWFIQSLTLIRCLKNFFKYGTFSYLIVSAVYGVLQSSALHLSHSQQSELLSLTQGAILFVMLLDFFGSILKSFDYKFSSTSNLTHLLKRVGLYSLVLLSVDLGSFALEPSFGEVVKDPNTAIFIICGFLILFILDFILYKIIVMKVTKEQSLNRWKAWIVLDTVEKQVEYSTLVSNSDRAIEVADYSGAVTQTVTVRLKYSKIRVSNEIYYSEAEKEVADLWEVRKNRG